VVSVGKPDPVPVSAWCWVKFSRRFEIHPKNTNSIGLTTLRKRSLGCAVISCTLGCRTLSKNWEGVHTYLQSGNTVLGQKHEFTSLAHHQMKHKLQSPFVMSRGRKLGISLGS